MWKITIFVKKFLNMGSQFKDVAIIACLKSFLYLIHIAFMVVSSLLLIMFCRTLLELERNVQKSMNLCDLFMLPSEVYALLKGAELIIDIRSDVAYLKFLLSGKLRHLLASGRWLVFNSVIGVALLATLVYDRDSCIETVRDNLTHCIDMNNFTETSLGLEQAQCCGGGVSSYKDWVKLCPQRLIPISCCFDVARCVFTATANFSDIYDNDCFESIQEGSRLMIGLSLGMVVLPLAGIVLSYSLGYYLKKRIINYKTLIIA